MRRRILKAGYLILKISMAVVFSAFLMYAGLSLWDMYQTEIKAFSSYDLLKYRPNIEEGGSPQLDELTGINPDTAGWVTLYGTNIDYPVMQGKTDTEYLSKDVTGSYTPTGSIVLSVLNAKDFSDTYSLLYGHHMRNGAMFGDIDKFKSKAFFYNKDNCRCKKEEGVLIKENKIYDLTVMALVETNAYDGYIYDVDEQKADLQNFLSQLKERSFYYRDPGETQKVLVLSTCNENSVTFGRSVLICQMKERTGPLSGREAELPAPHRKAVSHPVTGSFRIFGSLVLLLLLIAAASLLFPVKAWLRNRKKENHREA